MPRNKVTEVFKYEELSDSAKQKAREWYTRDYPDHDWWDSCYEVFTEVCEIIGVELETKPVRLMGGGTRREPMIFFSGFWSPGDGACFAGQYRQGGLVMDNIKKIFPQDTELHKIAQALEEVQDRYNQQVVVDITTSGRYSHSGTMSFEVHDVEDSEGETVEVSPDDCDTLKDNLRWLADWLYRMLEKEYEWLTSDEVVGENIIANGYEFDEYGNPE